MEYEKIIKIAKRVEIHPFKNVYLKDSFCYIYDKKNNFVGKVLKNELLKHCPGKDRNNYVKNKSV